jgi:hypothetical protein
MGLNRGVVERCGRGPVRGNILFESRWGYLWNEFHDQTPKQGGGSGKVFGRGQSCLNYTTNPIKSDIIRPTQTRVKRKVRVNDIHFLWSLQKSYSKKTHATVNKTQLPNKIHILLQPIMIITSPLVMLLKP